MKKEADCSNHFLADRGFRSVRVDERQYPRGRLKEGSASPVSSEKVVGKVVRAVDLRTPMPAACSGGQGLRPARTFPSGRLSTPPQY
jgi:hypothetical protein